MMMFTTELSHRVFLTVLLLILGVVVQNQGLSPGEVSTTIQTTKSENNDKAGRENEEEQGHFKSILYSNSPNSYYDDYRSQDFNSRRRNQPPPSSVMIKANLPFTTTAQKTKTNNNRDYNKRNGLEPPSYANNGFFDCFFGKNCLVEDDGKDEWRNYYSVLNGLDKPPVLSDRFSMQKLPFGAPGDYQTGISAAIPFIVDSNVSKFNNRKGEAENDEKDGKSPYRRYSQFGNSPVPLHSRLSRTTTSSPNWVKLQPLPAHMYDPFPTKNKSGGVTNMKTKDDGESGGSTSKFASRVGNADPEEISPETFAARYGWNKDSQQNLRLPAWLEELNQQHGYRDKGQQQQQGGQRPSFSGGVYNEEQGPLPGDDRGWVKLDPIPVSGVTISKWVPKGTSPSELPSTNWPVRDKPNAWWDRIDVGIGRPESPWSDGPIRSPLHSSNPGSTSSSSWGSNSNRYPPLNHNKNHHGQSHSQLSDAWSDVIYPDTPASATASWEASKKVTAGSSSFPSSWLSKGGGGGGGNAGNKYSGRPAVASWSANGNSGNNNKISAGRFGNQNQRLPPPSSFGRPSFYPDPKAGSDDPRWVLVSTTGETSAKNPPYRVNTPIDRDRDRDRYSDFPYEFHSQHSHRNSKVMNFSKIIDPPPSPMGVLTQDELFRRTNETLNSLAPVLLHRQGLLATTEEPEPFQTFIPLLDEDDKLEVIQDKGRSGNGKAEAQRKDKSLSDSVPATPAEGGTRKTFLQGINPVLAAVGAGMIPATIAAVLPVALGRRRKRHVLVDENRYVVPRLVRTPHHHHQRNLPIFLSSSAPSMYKFLRKPAMRNSYR